MSLEDQIRSQEELNRLKEEEAAYIQESYDFLARTVSLSQQINDILKAQAKESQVVGNNQGNILKNAIASEKVLNQIGVDYTDISSVSKDQNNILKQIDKNQISISQTVGQLSKKEKANLELLVKRERKARDLTKQVDEELRRQQDLVDAGKEISQEDSNKLRALQNQARYADTLVDKSKERTGAAAQEAAALMAQNDLLEEGLGYLQEEEDAIYTIAKAQGLWNSSLGAVESILKKAGAGGATIALGLERGKQEAQAMAEKLTNYGEDSGNFIKNIGREFRVLGAGIKGTFKGMADSLKAISLGALLIGAFKKAFKLIGGGLVVKFISDLKDKFTSGIKYLKDQFFSLSSYIDDAKTGDAFNQRMAKATADIATNIGVSTKNARELVTQAGKVSSSLGMMPEELAATTAGLQEAFGTTQRFSDDTVKTMGQLTNLLGLTNEEAAEFVKLSQLSGQEASDTTLTYKTQIQALKERENIAVSEKEIMKEIAKSSAAQQLTFRGSGKSLAEAAFHAKKLGLSLQQTEAIGGKLLNFESSIASEMEAELMLGRDLNLERARSAALEGDLATVAKEVAGQIGSAAEFGKMNVLQQEALADSIGVSRDELADMLKTQELLAGTGFDDMNDAQKQFKKLLKETGSEEAALAKMREMGASDALQAQLRQVSLEEKRALQQRAVEAAQGRLANAVNKVFDAFFKVEASVKRLKAVIVDQMKPFFNEFGNLIGNGAGELEQRLVPGSEKLGQFLNK